MWTKRLSASCWQMSSILSFWLPHAPPDSYIANQSGFSSINDKDLHYYKNLRNLWVFGDFTRKPSNCAKLFWNVSF